MAVQASSSDQLPAATAQSSSATPSQSQLQTAFDNGIWYLLSLWPALHVACQNNWGGPDCSDKRDWFAGAISDLFIQRPDTDFEDLVVVLLQVMQDEFDSNVEDDSEEDVARSILVLRKRLIEDGDPSAFQEVEQRWRNRGRMKTDIKVIDGEVEVDENDEDWDDEDEDVEMEDAGEAVQYRVPALRKEKIEPEVDEDGFTKVVRKR